MILDADNGKVIAQFPIGKGVDGAGFDNASKLIYSSRGHGTLTIIKEISRDNFEMLDNTNTGQRARTMTFDSQTTHVFTATPHYGATPAATPENLRARPAILPGNLMLLEYDKK